MSRAVAYRRIDPADFDALTMAASREIAASIAPLDVMNEARLRIYDLLETHEVQRGRAALALAALWLAAEEREYRLRG
jgi:hypothetical protein